MAVLRFLSFLGWLAVFAVLLLFAIKNTEPATLHFYFDRTWQAPLVFIVAASFVAGAVFGVIACIAPIMSGWKPRSGSGAQNSSPVKGVVHGWRSAVARW